MENIKPSIKIDVVSDVVCPWCYIGKRRLETAIAQLSDSYNFEVSYLPFELMPEMPAEGRNTRQHLTQKFGSAARYEQIVNQVSAVAAQEGLHFDLFNQEISPNTRSLHRIIHFAKQQGRQLELVEAFFKAYFEDAVNLTNRQNVLDIAQKAGLDPQAVAEVLENQHNDAVLEAQLHRNHQMGISGVPFYIINGQFGISGAQPAEVFLDAFAQIAPQAVAEGQACDVETGEC
jgi:predicted DsbA family dithiol-disulfide isomerase